MNGCVQRNTSATCELEPNFNNCIFYKRPEHYFTYLQYLLFPYFLPRSARHFRGPIHRLLSLAPSGAGHAAIETGIQPPQHIESSQCARAAYPGGLRHAADLVAFQPFLVPYRASNDFPIGLRAVITYASILSPPVVVSGERTAATAAVGNAGTRN